MLGRRKKQRFWHKQQKFREIEEGQLYRQTGLNRFNRSHRVWRVTGVRRLGDGLLAADLQALDHPVERKTISIEALRDARMYQPVEDG